LQKETIDWKWEISCLKDSLDFLKTEIHNLSKTNEDLAESMKLMDNLNDSMNRLTEALNENKNK